jgi:hypothetical protein
MTRQFSNEENTLCSLTASRTRYQQYGMYGPPVGGGSESDWGKGRETSDLDEFRFDGDVHRIADQDSPGFECGVPCKTEVLAVDLGHGLQANADISPRVPLRRRWAFNGEGDRPSDAMDVRSPVTG